MDATMDARYAKIYNPVVNEITSCDVFPLLSSLDIG